MTGHFRKLAYETVDRHAGAKNHMRVEIIDGNQRWVMPLGELKQMLYRDRQHRKRERKAAHAG